MKKTTRNFFIYIAFCIFILLLSLVYGYFFAKIPELTSDSVGKFKFLSAASFFCLIIPSVFAASANVVWCIEFGLHPENSRLRFSNAMFRRYKGVIINSLIFVFIVTCAGEILMPQIYSRIKNMEFKPQLMREYQNSARYFFENKNYETAFHFAQLAYEIDPKNKENQKIIHLTESYNDKKEEISESIKKQINEMTFKGENFDIYARKPEIISTPYKSFELMQTAKDCIAKKDWFGAHYYSQLAIKTSDPKDINITELKQISAEAWNRLNQARQPGTSAEQKIFAKKYEGYVSLINGDILRSYYIFHALSLESKKLSADPDIVRYLEISEKFLKSQYFFRDETKNLQEYECANSVYFKIQENASGNSTLYFIHGITSDNTAKNMILYLRGLEIIELDESGSVISGCLVPYAKMTALQTEFLDEDTKKFLEIDKKITAVPYILLNSVDRNLPDQTITPEYKIGLKKTPQESFKILKMPFSDFELIEQASSGADSMNLISLFNFVSKAEKYGYSAESFAHILMNRMLKPLYLLILFIVIAYHAWHFRLEENSVFKFKWIIMFPVLCAAYYFLYKLALCLFKFINYGLLGVSGVSFSIAAGTIVYVLIFAIVSVFFLSCRNSSGR